MTHVLNKSAALALAVAISFALMIPALGIPSDGALLLGGIA